MVGPADRRNSIPELERQLDGWEARLVTQRIEERIGLEEFEPGVAQAHRGVEPLERLGVLAPLRVNRGVLVSPGLPERGLDFRQFDFCIGVPSELVVHDCQTLLADPVSPFRLAQGTRARQVAETVEGEPALPVGSLVIGIEVDCVGEGGYGLPIAPAEIERIAERRMTAAVERVEYDRAA